MAATVTSQTTSDIFIDDDLKVSPPRYFSSVKVTWISELHLLMIIHPFDFLKSKNIMV